MAKPRTPAPHPVDAYFAKVPPKFRAELLKVRATVRALAPDAEELLSYRMPAFRKDGILLYYGAFSDHLSLFVAGRETRERYAKELKPFEGGKGTVHFTPEHPLPIPLLRKIVRSRLAENAARRAR